MNVGITSSPNVGPIYNHAPRGLCRQGEPHFNCVAGQSCCPKLQSKADICSASANVLFTPESGRVRRKPSCLLWAKSGHSQVREEICSMNREQKRDRGSQLPI